MDQTNVARQRRAMMPAFALTFGGSALLWAALLAWLPAWPGRDSFATAVQCCALAALLTLVTGVNAIAHERLFSPAIDPLAGHETARMRVNARYLSNTVEQYLLFAAGLLALSAYAGPRIVVAAAVVWVVNRWAFWVGYHRGSLHRTYGAAGVLQSLLILVYCAWRSATDAVGIVGGVAVMAIFVIIEVVLFRSALRPTDPAS